MCIPSSPYTPVPFWLPPQATQYCSSYALVFQPLFYSSSWWLVWRDTVLLSDGSCTYENEASLAILLRSRWFKAGMCIIYRSIPRFFRVKADVLRRVMRAFSPISRLSFRLLFRLRLITMIVCLFLGHGTFSRFLIWTSSFVATWSLLFPASTRSFLRWCYWSNTQWLAEKYTGLLFLLLSSILVFIDCCSSPSCGRTIAPRHSSWSSRSSLRLPLIFRWPKADLSLTLTFFFTAVPSLLIFSLLKSRKNARK